MLVRVKCLLFKSISASKPYSQSTLSTSACLPHGLSHCDAIIGIIRVLQTSEITYELDIWQCPLQIPAPECQEYEALCLQTTPVYRRASKHLGHALLVSKCTLLNKHAYYLAYLTWKEALLNIAVKLSLQLKYWICTNIFLQNKKNQAL